VIVKDHTPDRVRFTLTIDCSPALAGHMQTALDKLAEKLSGRLTRREYADLATHSIEVGRSKTLRKFPGGKR
jgi:hypothetical protein